jgi:predicted amidohydrolase
VYATPDLGFSEDGVVAKGHANQEEILMADLDLKLINNVRQNGSVLNYKHHQKLLTELQNPFKIELIDLET